MNKLANVSSGEIYAIPLFVSDEHDLKRFKKNEFNDRGKEFVFCRIIEDMGGGGVLIEVFDLVGDLNQDLESIISSKRLFKPVAISGVGIYKKRWKKIHFQEDYDKEKHSKYSEITLVAGTADNYGLWKGGEDFGSISELELEAQGHERWKVWRASHLEKRIIKELFGSDALSN